MGKVETIIGKVEKNNRHSRDKKNLIGKEENNNSKVRNI